MYSTNLNSYLTVITPAVNVTTRGFGTKDYKYGKDQRRELRPDVDIERDWFSHVIFTTTRTQFVFGTLPGEDSRIPVT